MPMLKKRKKQPDRSPKLRSKKNRGTARQELKRDNRSGTPPCVPQFGMKPIPDLETYPKDKSGEPKTHLGGSKEFKSQHEVDWRFAGWAKGYSDGTFDVSCKLCGEVGRIELVVAPKDVAWG